jgi:hypothetical protein
MVGAPPQGAVDQIAEYVAKKVAYVGAAAIRATPDGLLTCDPKHLLNRLEVAGIGDYHNP